tara:strand:+ start:3192 stop:3446 length:255 start_codon:yes stop_codon:yes gene_type:complete
MKCTHLHKDAPENSLCEECYEIARDICEPVDEYPMSNCCTAPFGYPGYPDNDICSACGEHADIGEVDEDLNSKQEDQVLLRRDE